MKPFELVYYMGLPLMHFTSSVASVHSGNHSEVAWYIFSFPPGTIGLLMHVFGIVGRTYSQGAISAICKVVSNMVTYKDQIYS